jgi:5-methylcytosine-specific restriction endonuclease McrA
MRKITKPTDKASDVFLDCIENLQDVNLKTRLTAVKQLIDSAANEFDNKVTKGQLHTVNRERLVNGNVTAKELEDVYTSGMVKRKAGRKYYDKIMISAPQGICPLCSQRVVSTLDHYLPKTEYPRLSVTPINLIPSCSDCNKLKFTNYPTKPFEEPLHPYYDDIENDIWLSATIVHTTPPSVKFDIIPPNNWSQLLVDRTVFHFQSLSLGKLYSVHAGVVLAQIQRRLYKLHQDLGAVGVKKHLEEEAETTSCENLNSWQTAMYKAMAADNWFCNGGFRF